MSEEQLFIAALEIGDPIERTAFLETACAGRTTLRRRMESLLRAHASAGEFLETPAQEVVAAQQAEEEWGPGSVIDRYAIVRPLGEGGMGAVYLANQLEPVQRQVALKLVRPGLVSEHVLTRFEAERQALAMMNHPNIARVFDAGATPRGQPYFVMELIEGSPILDYCRAHQLPLRARLELLARVCHAVQHAHQKGILHRDLKPANILIVEYDGKPMPKVIDFGVAKVLGQPVLETVNESPARMLEGTLEYMSPEQARQDFDDVDSRSDVYSLGVLLYELVTGTTPLRRELLQARTLPDMLRTIREVEPSPPRGGVMDTTITRLSRLEQAELDCIALRALNKDRNERYGTAMELGAELQRFLSEEPVQAAIGLPAYRIKKFLRKHRKGVVVSLAGLASLIAMTIFSLNLAYRATQAEAGAVLESQRATAERNRAVVAEEATRLERNKAVAAQQLAQDEAATAKAVLDFLVLDLFLEVDPQKNPRSKHVTVEELMDRAAVRIDGKFARQPNTESMLRQVMGVMYRKLGNLPAAQKHLERALELRKANLGEDHDDTLNTMDALAVVYDGQLKRSRAAELMRQSYEKSLNKRGADYVLTMTKLCNLGVLLAQAGRLKEAEPLQRECYERNLERLGEDNPTTLVSLHNLGSLFLEQGRLEEAEQALDKALRARRRVQGEEHPRTISSMHMLAVLYQYQGRHEEARKLLQETIRLSEKVLGPEHLATLNSRRWLAFDHETTGDQRQADVLYQQLLEMLRRSSAPDGIQEAEVLLALAQSRIRQQKYDEAAKFLVQSEAKWGDCEQPDWRVRYLHLLRAAISLGQQKPAEGAAAVRLACQGLRPCLEDSTRRAKVLVHSALEDVRPLCELRGLTAEEALCRDSIAWVNHQLRPIPP